MKKLIVLTAVLILFLSNLKLFSEPVTNNKDNAIEQDSTALAGDISVTAYPNPCDDHLTFKFSIKETNYIKLKIFDFNGNLVKTVIDDVQYSGETEHNINFNASHLSSGAYEYMLQTAGKYKAGKFVVQR